MEVLYQPSSIPPRSRSFVRAVFSLEFDDTARLIRELKDLPGFYRFWIESTSDSIPWRNRVTFIVLLAAIFEEEDEYKRYLEQRLRDIDSVQRVQIFPSLMEVLSFSLQ